MTPLDDGRTVATSTLDPEKNNKVESTERSIAINRGTPVSSS
jgi:hypothetical protein